MNLSYLKRKELNPQPGVKEKSAYGVLYQLKNGCNWSDLPSCFTSLLNSILALQTGASQFCKMMKRNQYYSRAFIANNVGLYISATIGENK